MHQLVLRVSPALGRAFTRHDEQNGNDRVVLLSDGLGVLFGVTPAASYIPARRAAVSDPADALRRE
jgi:hypothetical protein